MGSKYVCRCQDCANNQLMVHFKEGHVFQITIDGKTYDVDFKKALQRNQRTKDRTIRCVSGPRVRWEMAAPPSQVPAMQKIPAPDMLAKLGKVLNQSISCQKLQLRGGWGVPGSKSAPLAAFATVCSINPWQTRAAWYLSWEHHSILERNFDFAKDIHVDQAANERLLLHGTKTFEVAQVMATEGFTSQLLGTMLWQLGIRSTHEVNAKTLSRALTEASDCAPALGLSWIIARLGRHLRVSFGVHDRFMWCGDLLFDSQAKYTKWI